MEVGAGEKKGKNDKTYDEKEAAYLDGTTPADMEVGVGEKK